MVTRGDIGPKRLRLMVHRSRLLFGARKDHQARQLTPGPRSQDCEDDELAETRRVTRMHVRAVLVVSRAKHPNPPKTLAPLVPGLPGDRSPLRPPMLRKVAGPLLMMMGIGRILILSGLPVTLLGVWRDDLSLPRPGGLPVARAISRSTPPEMSPRLVLIPVIVRVGAVGPGTAGVGHLQSILQMRS